MLAGFLSQIVSVLTYLEAEPPERGAPVSPSAANIRAAVKHRRRPGVVTLARVQTCAWVMLDCWASWVSFGDQNEQAWLEVADWRLGHYRYSHTLSTSRF